MVFHRESDPRGCLVEDASKIHELGLEGNCTDGEDTKQAKLDGQYLVCTSNLDGNSHCKLLVFVFGRVLVLLDEETTASL